MNDYNTKFEYKQVNSKLILSDLDYQRTIDPRRVKRIVSAFDEKLVNPEQGILPGNKYYVFERPAHIGRAENAERRPGFAG